MNSRKWAFWVILSIFATSSLVLYVAWSVLIKNQIIEIESKDTQQDVSRVEAAIKDQLDELEFKAVDWSKWDDTYRFVKDLNKSYIDANLVNESLVNLSINYMLYYNDKQQLVYSKGVDSDGDSQSIPDDLLEFFKPNSSLLANNPDDSHKGFISVDDTIVFCTSQAIMPSSSVGQVRGTLVFCDTMTESDITQISGLTLLDVAIFRLSQNLPANLRTVQPAIMTDKVVVERMDINLIAGYTLVKDINNKPLFIIQVKQDRSVFINSQVSIRYFFLIIIVTVLLSLLLATYISRQVIARDKVIQLKDEFFSIASHELRTPLTAIKGNAQLLQTYYKDKNDSDFNEITQDIHDSSLRLIRLVNNFLDAARFEAGKVPLTLEPTSIKEVATQVTNELQALAKSKNLYIRTEMKDDLPLALVDKDRVTQVIYNIVGNAAKFTETGGITIGAIVRNDQIVVLVSDTGRGISSEGQKILFSKFTQVKSSDSKTGSGLGLYISKMLVELMGGTLAIEKSAVDVGTTLSFSLPVAKPKV